jgi:hypothetical protein
MSTATALTRLEREVAGLTARMTARTDLTAVAMAERAGLAPDPWQARVLSSEARQLILLCSRQAGKSTVTSVLAAHRAMSVPESLVLLVAPALRQSQELFRKVRGVLTALGDEMPRTVDNALTLEFANGSRIVTLPGSEKTIRGYSAPDLIIEDEASRVPDELAMAMRPMRATKPDSQLILLSSPFGARGHFYETWEHGGQDWERVKVTALDIPRIDPAWLEAERAAIGDWWFDQEYLCVFRDPIDSAFRSEDIEAMADTGIVPLFGRVA